MAELTRKPVVPAKHFAIQYQPEANAPTDIDHHCILFSNRCAETQFSQCDKTRIVIYINRYTDLVGDIFGNALTINFQKSVVDPFLHINKTRHTDAHTGYLFSGNTRIGNKLIDLFGEYGKCFRVLLKG